MHGIKSGVLAVTLLFLTSLSFAQAAGGPAKSEGIRLFEQNRPDEAIAFLEADIAEGKAALIEYNYLGLAYFQTGNYEKSAEAFTKGIGVPGTNKKMLYLNLGNSYFALGEYEKALEAFSMAGVADPAYPAPVLNRANTELKLEKFSDALDDYRRYLTLDPESSRRPLLENLITMLEEKIAGDSENERLSAEEEARLKAEEERLAGEQAEQEEGQDGEDALSEKKRTRDDERRLKMLGDVSSSLREKSGPAGISAGLEKALEYRYSKDFSGGAE